jgi:hypothetical protein
MSFHLQLLGPTGAYWLDDPSDLTCKDSTQQHAVDDPLLSCKQPRPQRAQHRLLRIPAARQRGGATSPGVAGGWTGRRAPM